jgi:Cell Wall Hydrolase/Family of unknown function (DUF5715)
MNTMTLRRDAQPIRKRGAIPVVYADTAAQLRHTLKDAMADFNHRNRALLENYQKGVLAKALSYKWQLEKQRLRYYLHKMQRMCYLPSKAVSKPEHLPVLVPAERWVLRILLAFTTVIFSFGLFQPSVDQSGTASAAPIRERAHLDTSATTPAYPDNWLDGDAELNGFAKDAITGPFNYATEAGLRFAQTDEDITEMVADGTLVRLEGPYLKLRDVSQPYVLPIVNQVANRLALQYAEQGCGKLTYTSAIRSIAFQEELGNGHPQSVHPTGMAIDAERFSDGSREAAFCLRWLNETLRDIEGARRLEATAERSPSHFHLVVVPHIYAAWLAKRDTSVNPEVFWLARALFFEGAFNESVAGYRAIGWAIKNRVASREYPNTIVEVVAEGAAGRFNGRCQFSFMCDGKREDIYELCRLASGELTVAGRQQCDDRWQLVEQLAAQIMNETADPTGGAVLYYARSMSNPPPWAATDMRRGTIRNIGGHRFACSVNRGDDVCRL